MVLSIQHHVIRACNLSDFDSTHLARGRKEREAENIDKKNGHRRR